MKIVMLLGDRSEKNAELLKAERDSLEIEAYSTISDMMNNITQRNAKFDRIIVSTGSMKDEQSMRNLYKFLRDLHPRATVVYIYQKGKSEAQAKLFNRIFRSPLYTDVAIESSNIKFFVSISISKIDELRELYSIGTVDDSDNDVVRDSYKASTGKTEQSEELHLKQPMMRLPQNRKQKRNTGMFGAKKWTKVERRINSINEQLVIALYELVKFGGDTKENPLKYTIPNSERKSMSNPLDDMQTSASSEGNAPLTDKRSNIFSGNLEHDSTFTPLELGHYGFANLFDGKPMMLRLGVRVSQNHDAY